MIKRPIICLLVLCAAAPLWANICATDSTPAASLLFPWVVVEYMPGPSMFSNPPVSAATSIITITNTSPDAQIVHVTLWTDYDLAFLDFNIIMTGYDVQRFNLRDILVWGQLPITLVEGHAGSEGVLGSGPVSETSSTNGAWLDDIMTLPEPTTTLTQRCSPASPSYPGLYVDPIPPHLLALYQMYLQSSQTAVRGHTSACDPQYTTDYYIGDWFESRDNEELVWLYVTADVVETCTSSNANDVGYWTGEALYDNVLVGHVTWMFPPFITASAQAVHLEADVDLASVVPEFDIGWPTSFYSRYSVVNDGVSDYREPLPTAWAVPYHYAPGLWETSIVAWKGSTHLPSPMDLGFAPADDPYEMTASDCYPYTYYIWDEEENVLSVSGTQLEPNLLPLVTQQVPISQFNTVASDGWMLFVFPPSNYGQAGAPTVPDRYQTWMGSFWGIGPSTAFLPANPMANANCFGTQVLPQLGVDADYVGATGYVSGGPQ